MPISRRNLLKVTGASCLLGLLPFKPTRQPEPPKDDEKGKFCGNHHTKSEPYPSKYINPYTQFEFELEKIRHQHELWLAKMDFGPPSNCGAGTSAQLKKAGYVGLFYKGHRRAAAAQARYRKKHAKELAKFSPPPYA